MAFGNREQAQRNHNTNEKNEDIVSWRTQRMGFTSCMTQRNPRWADSIRSADPRPSWRWYHLSLHSLEQSLARPRSLSPYFSASPVWAHGVTPRYRITIILVQLLSRGRDFSDWLNRVGFRLYITAFPLFSFILHLSLSRFLFNNAINWSRFDLSRSPSSFSLHLS